MWYTLFVMSGIENHVVNYLQKRVQLLNNEVPHEVFCPTRQLVHLNQGVQTIVKRTLFPGYIFLRTENITCFKEIAQCCTGFLTILRDSDLLFETVRQDEIDAIRVLLNEQNEIEFSSGCVENDRVRIVSGPLRNYCGQILKINKRECKAKIQLNFSGKEIFTFVGLNALEKIEEEDAEDARDIYFQRKQITHSNVSV